MRGAIGGLQPLDCANGPVPDTMCQRRTTVVRNAVYSDGARTALTTVAADLGAGQSEFVAQRVGQCLLRRDLCATRLAIDVQGNQALDAGRRRTLRQGRTITCGGCSGDARGDYRLDEAPA